VLFGTKVNIDHLPPFWKPPKRMSKDLWDVIIEEVTEVHRKRRVEGYQRGKKIAGEVAEMMTGYWEAQRVQQEKEAEKELKRLKGVAKATVKLVVSEWKRAVHVCLL